MSTNPLHSFEELRTSQPNLSDSELLNSNNKMPFTSSPDVAITGAGIMGLCYAIHLKNISPELSISIFEKSSYPMQNIGESTLSTFSRFTQGRILPHDYFLRLFAIKDGLQFYCVDEKAGKITAEDIGGLDVSFQLDRRVSELLLTMWAQEMGINVYHGMETDFETGENIHSPIDAGVKDKNLKIPSSAPKTILKGHSNLAGQQINAKFVCDATGFSRKLTSKFGNREKFPGWNCDAYWAYFKDLNNDTATSNFTHWNHPATKDICFSEGWGWFIKLISWHRAPLANLMDLVAYPSSSFKRGIPGSQLPSTTILSDMVECPYEFITSIG